MTKRLIAYLIDIIIISLIISIIGLLLPNIGINYNHDLNLLNESFLKGNITMHQFLSDYAYLSYIIDKSNVTFTALNLCIMIIYFIIVPLINNGQTLGLKLLNIKINGKINIKNLFIRNILTIGLLYTLISIIIVHVLNFKYYFITMTILGFIQFLLVIISIFMIIYRKDEKGLQDILSNTYIEKVK